MQNELIALLGLPAITVGLLFLFGRLVGKYGAVVLVMQQFFCSLCVVVWIARAVFLQNCTFYFELGKWMTTVYSIKWSFLLDPLSVGMIIIIEIIGFCVIVYAIEYLYNDPHFNRFLILLCLFMFCMLLLVTSGNFVQFLIGWEGVGIVSYLLVNFWFSRLEANRSAIKAVIFNRVGDVGLILAIVLFCMLFKTFEFSVLFGNLMLFEKTCHLNFLNVNFNISGFSILASMLLLAAAGKSAQIGLHAWLPDAMEGPTPVSALLHSATMVTAGIFLLLRFSPLFVFTPLVMEVSVILGGLTAFCSALFAVFQVDIKKIIAFSTCSQLGFMLVSFGCYQPLLTFFHLLTHAFFKALLFLAAGVVIHALQNEQDIRRMGGLIHYMPLTFVVMLIGNLALTGFPFLSGFYSKEFILLLNYTVVDKWVFVVGLALSVSASILTVLYSVKLLFRVFLSKTFNGYRSHLITVQDGGVFSTFSLVVLSTFSIFSGFLTLPFFANFPFLVFSGQWAGIFDKYLIDSFSWLEYEMTSVVFKFLFFTFFVFCLVVYRVTERVQEQNSIYLNILTVYNSFTLGRVLKRLFLLLSNQIVFSHIYRCVTFQLYKAGYLYMFYLLDRGVFEHIGPLRIFSLFFNLSAIFYYSLQNKKLVSFLFVFIFFPVTLFGLGVSEGYFMGNTVLYSLIIVTVLIYFEFVLFYLIHKINFMNFRTYKTDMPIFTKVENDN